jgi:hypothetical protein
MLRSVSTVAFSVEDFATFVDAFGEEALTALAETFATPLDAEAFEGVDLLAAALGAAVFLIAVFVEAFAIRYSSAWSMNVRIAQY